MTIEPDGSGQKNFETDPPSPQKVERRPIRVDFGPNYPIGAVKISSASAGNPDAPSRAFI
jgi:hypothetical protein